MGPLWAAIKRYLRAAAGALYLFTFGFFRPRYASVVTALASVVRKPVAHQPRAVRISFQDLVPDPPAVRLLHLPSQDGNVSIMELAYLCQLTALEKPEGIFEFGTFNGRTALNLIRNAPDSATLVTLDLPDEEVETTAFRLDPGEKIFPQASRREPRLYRGTREESRIEQLLGDSGRFDFRPLQGRFDLVFIDASHTYENVQNDCRNASGLLRNGRGLILWHDYSGWEGVTRAVDEYAAACGRLGELRHIEGTSLAYLRIA